MKNDFLPWQSHLQCGEFFWRSTYLDDCHGTRPLFTVWHIPRATFRLPFCPTRPQFRQSFVQSSGSGGRLRRVARSLPPGGEVTPGVQPKRKLVVSKGWTRRGNPSTKGGVRSTSVPEYERRYHTHVGASEHGVLTSGDFEDRHSLWHKVPLC